MTARSAWTKVNTEHARYSEVSAKELSWTLGTQAEQWSKQCRWMWVVELESAEGCWWKQQSKGMIKWDVLPAVVDKCHYELVQRKHVEIHKVCWGNKWMSSLTWMLWTKQTRQTADQSLNMVWTTTRSNTANKGQTSWGCDVPRLDLFKCMNVVS